MRIDIRSLGFSLTAPLLDHIERRLLLVLARTSDRIKRVVIRLGDANGPRGGEDKFCRMQVYLRHASPVLIIDAGVDLYAAIDRVAERARQRCHAHLSAARARSAACLRLPGIGNNDE